MSLALLLNVVLAVLLGVAYVLWRRERARRQEVTLRGPFPIPTVGVEALDPVFTPGPYGATLETEVAFVGRGSLEVTGGTSDAESWVLAVLAKRARLLFEFGTCTGKTAYLWARNAPPDARIVTVTLHPAEAHRYTTASGDVEQDRKWALVESSFTEFLYTGSPVAAKVEQLFADSKELDVSAWMGQCDLVFVDGSHAYSYVMSDSRKALAMVRPGGLVLWHDYAGPGHAPGVWRALNELAREIPLVHVARTAFVAHRKPDPVAVRR